MVAYLVKLIFGEKKRVRSVQVILLSYLKFMNVEGHRYLASSPGLDEHWAFVMPLCDTPSGHSHLIAVQPGLQEDPWDGVGVQGLLWYGAPL